MAPTSNSTALTALLAELSGDLGLRRRRLSEQLLQAVALFGCEEPPRAEDRGEGIEEDGLLGEEIGAERRPPHRRVVRRPHQHPSRRVGGQTELDTRGPTQECQPVDGRGRPLVAGRARLQARASRVGGHEQSRTRGAVAHWLYYGVAPPEPRGVPRAK